MLPPGAGPEASAPNGYAQIGNAAWTSLAANQAVHKIAEQQVGRPAAAQVLSVPGCMADRMDAWVDASQLWIVCALRS